MPAVMRHTGGGCKSFLSVLLLFGGVELPNPFVLATVTPTWMHSWNTSADFWWGDFGYSLLTESQAEFVATHYKIVSLEKCTGNPMPTEEAIYKTAKQLKKINPLLKVLFYHSVTQAGVSCYAANDEFMKHPEWHLKDDNGNFVHGPRIDTTIEAAREWWLQVPMNSALGWEDGLIDGILADDVGFNSIPNMTISRMQEQYNGKHTLIQAMQARFNTDSAHGIVLGNGISEYDQSPTDPHNLEALEFMDVISRC